MMPRGADRWLIPYARQWSRRQAVRADEKVDLILCIADHFEPRYGPVTDDVAQQRVESWLEKYPERFGDFTDSDGRPPRHTCFYPLEQYDRLEMEGIAELCAAGFGEVEVHLHHNHDTSFSLRCKLIKYARMLHERHGLLSHRRGEKAIAYGFVHGNWALDNSRPDGEWCGVNDELDVLRETGCYADFTLPSAPSATQTPTINSIYYATDDPESPRSHDYGVAVGAEKQPDHSLMLIQGPLMLDWQRRKFGVLPRIENACIQYNQHPSMARLDQWLAARVQVPTRPDWFFVKLHTHGAPEANQDVLLGEPMTRFHRDLAHRARENPNFRYHYVTAREMYNLVKAAEAGWTADVNGARDHELICTGLNRQTIAPRESDLNIRSHTVPAASVH